VRDGRRRREQEFRSLVEPFAERTQPREPREEITRELKCALCPADVIVEVVSLERKVGLRLEQPSRLGVKSAEPARCVRYRARDTIDAIGSLRILDCKPGSARRVLDQGADKTGSGGAHPPEQHAIDERFVLDVSAMSVLGMTRLAFVLAEDLERRPVGPPAGHDLLRKRAAEDRLTIDDLQ